MTNERDRRHERLSEICLRLLNERKWHYTVDELDRIFRNYCIDPFHYRAYNRFLTTRLTRTSQTRAVTEPPVSRITKNEEHIANLCREYLVEVAFLERDLQLQLDELKQQILDIKNQFLATSHESSLANASRFSQFETAVHALSGMLPSTSSPSLDQHKQLEARIKALEDQSGSEVAQWKKDVAEKEKYAEHRISRLRNEFDELSKDVLKIHTSMWGTFEGMYCVSKVIVPSRSVLTLFERLFLFHLLLLPYHQSPIIINHQPPFSISSILDNEAITVSTFKDRLEEVQQSLTSLATRVHRLSRDKTIRDAEERAKEVDEEGNSQPLLDSSQSSDTSTSPSANGNSSNPAPKSVEEKNAETLQPRQRYFENVLRRLENRDREIEEPALKLRPLDGIVKIIPTSANAIFAIILGTLNQRLRDVLDIHRFSKNLRVEIANPYEKAITFYQRHYSDLIDEFWRVAAETGNLVTDKVLRVDATAQLRLTLLECVVKSGRPASQLRWGPPISGWEWSNEDRWFPIVSNEPSTPRDIMDHPVLLSMNGRSYYNPEKLSRRYRYLFDKVFIGHLPFSAELRSQESYISDLSEVLTFALGHFGEAMERYSLADPEPGSAYLFQRPAARLLDFYVRSRSFLGYWLEDVISLGRRVYCANEHQLGAAKMLGRDNLYRRLRRAVDSVQPHSDRWSMSNRDDSFSFYNPFEWLPIVVDKGSDKAIDLEAIAHREMEEID